MRRIGTISFYVLIAYFALNAVPAIYSLFRILTGDHAPGFAYLYSAAEIRALDPQVLDLGDGFASLLNSLIIAYCIAAIGLLIAIRRRAGGTLLWLILVASFAVVQAGSYVSDHYFASKNIVVLNVSSVVVALALAGLSRLRVTEGEPHVN